MGQKWSKIQTLRLKMKFTGLIALLTKIPEMQFFARQALISGEGQQENLDKKAKTGKSFAMQIKEWSILIETTGFKRFVYFLLWFSHMLDQIICQNLKKSASRQRRSIYILS